MIHHFQKNFSSTQNLRNFDERHGTRELSQLHPGDTVLVPDRQSSATVTGEIAPRSYSVDTSDVTFRRNRRHLLTTPGDESSKYSSSPDVSYTDQENGD